jgi:hypothetical protein
MGINVTGGYDLDQDGVPDLAAGSLGTDMNVYSGRDGTFLARFPRSANYYTCSGEVLAMLAPPPGEQYPVFVYSERCWGITPANGVSQGVVFAYRGCPKGVRRFGMADASPNQPLARTGMRSPTAATTPTVRFTMSDAPPGVVAMLTLGNSDAAIGGVALPLALDPFGLPGITLWTSAEARLLTIAGSTGMNAGYAAFDIVLPPGRVIDYTGTPLYAQWLWFDPTNVTNHGSTAGQRFRLQ